ncbi:MAG: hypothetical protein ACREOO_14475 [bacterium]
MNLEHLNKTLLLFALAALSFLTEPAWSQPTYQVPVGTRPRSMGEAFVAVADDGNAIRWNPAGLARLELIQASFSYTNIFGLDIDNYYAGLVSRPYFIPLLTDYLTFGVDWSGIHTREEELGAEVLRFTEDQFNFALALRPPQNWPLVRHLGLGVNAKYLKQTENLDGRPEGDMDGWGWELGLLYNLGELPYVPPGIHFGLMVHDVNGTFVKHETGRTEEILPQNLRWGLSYRPFEQWPGGKIPISDPVLALDIDDRVHLGMEFWLSRVLALRAGFQKDRHTDEGATFSFGLGFKARLHAAPGLNVDYALTDSPTLPNSPSQFGGALIFKNNPRLIRIEESHIEDVFASLYLHYGAPGASVGTVKLRNLSESDTLKARLTFLASRYMLPQQPDTVLIEPGRTLDFPLRAVFTPEVFDTRDGRLTGEVRVAYDYKRAEHTARAAVDFAIYSQNYLIWDDACKAAAFVTANDPLVGKFVEEVRATESDSTKASWFTRYERGEALKLYHALQAYNIDYRLDAKTPFPSLRGAPYRRDQITYPAKFLAREKRYGDCDDLAVLYATLLQHAGFSTALVSVPGHLFMMFDTEVDTAEYRTLPLPPRLFVPYQGTLWIPVETTMMADSSFVAAWQEAAEGFSDAEQREIFEVAACQASYPPPQVPVGGNVAPALPNFSYRLEKNLQALEAIKRNYFRSFADSLAQRPGEVKLRNQYGATLAENGEFDQALQQFETIHRTARTFAPAWNNHGNVEVMLGRFNRAKAWYDSALAHNAYSRGTYLNLAILYQLMKDDASKDSVNYYQRKSDEALLKAAQYLEGDVASAYALLGMQEESIESKAGPVDWVKARVRKARKFVDTAFRMYVQKKEIRNVPLDRHGPKGRNEVDADRGMTLYWSF